MWTSWAPRSCASRGIWASTLRISSVAAIANTPSANVSRRAVLTLDESRRRTCRHTVRDLGIDRYFSGVRGSHTTNPWLVLVLICVAQFMVILDATIVNVALPSIQKDLGLSEANLQWIINSYTLVFGGFLLLGGRAGDLLGRKRVFLTGLVIFTVASLLNGLSTSSRMLDRKSV